MRLLLIGLVFLAACASNSHKLSKDAEQVKVLMRKSKDCPVMGKYKGVHEKGSVEMARNQARNLAANDGANSIFFDEEFSNGGIWTVWAIAYRCK